jgi:multimeric flavodoxin WrbA
MYLLGINGSMRIDGNTNILIDAVFKSAKKENPNLKSKILQLRNLEIGPCLSNYEQCSKKPYVCTVKDDLDKVLQEMKKADAIVLGSPLYFNIPARLTALIERMVCLSYFYRMRNFKEPHPLADKPIGLIAVSAENDTIPVLQHLLNFALFLKMKPVFIDAYPFIGISGRGGYKDNLPEAKEMGKLLVK